MPSWSEKAQVDNNDMPLYVSVPASGGPVPGIVVVHGQSGLESFIKDTTHMLALQGTLPSRQIFITAMVRTAKTTIRRGKRACAIRRSSTTSMLPSDSLRITGRSTVAD